MARTAARQDAEARAREVAVRALAAEAEKFLQSGPSARRAMAGVATQVASLADDYVALERAEYLRALSRVQDDDGEVCLAWLPSGVRLEPLARLLRMAFHRGGLHVATALTNRVVNRLTGGQFRAYDPNVVVAPAPKWAGRGNHKYLADSTFPVPKSITDGKSLLPRIFKDIHAVHAFYAYLGAPVDQQPDPVEPPGGPLPIKETPCPSPRPSPGGTSTSRKARRSARTPKRT